MKKKGNLIIPSDVPNAFTSSFEGKYIIMDNLDEKSDPIIQEQEEVYNADYVYVTVVLRGTLRLTVGGNDIEVKANEYLAVTPCMSIKIKESRCIFFSFQTISHIMGEIYERTNVKKIVHFHAFKFRHVHFDPERISILFDCYRRIKREHQRENYQMKEMVLRAYQGAYVIKLFSIVSGEDIISYTKKSSRQYAVFNEFILLLDDKHKENRSVQYYANMMKITPKYLSTVVHTFTGLTASQVIDQYVVFSIKQYLYKNDRNVKAISEVFHFPSQSFFGRYFKRVCGVSPNQYTKHHNIRSINFLSNNKEE